jgi:hypothetical protein
MEPAPLALEYVPANPTQGARTTTGAVHLPPENAATLAAWLSRASMHTPRKSTIYISTTGRRPAIAAATPAPRKALSLMGAPRTRPGPKRTSRLRRSNGISSPKRMMRGSSAMAWASASSTACVKDMVLMMAPPPGQLKAHCLSLAQPGLPVLASVPAPT